MAESRTSRRGLRKISSLFISSNPSHTLTEIRPKRRDCASNGPETAPETADRRALTVGLTYQLAPKRSFYFAFSFSHWLLSFFPKTALITSSPEPTAWSEIAGRYGLPPVITGAGPASTQSFRIHHNLCLIVTDATPDQMLAEEEATGQDPLPATAGSGCDRVIVHALDHGLDDSARRLMKQCDLFVSVMPNRIEAFIEYYRFIKAAPEERKQCQLAFVLDHGEALYDLKAIEAAWESIGGRFLNAPARILGQLDSSGLSDETDSLTRRLHLCEKNLILAPADLEALRRSAASAGPERQQLMNWVRRREAKAAPDLIASAHAAPSAGPPKMRE